MAPVRVISSGKRYQTAPIIWMSFFLAGGTSPVALAKVVDKTLAIVNGEAILLSEFERTANPVVDQFQRVTPVASQSPERLKELKKRLLEQMVDDKLLSQEAKKRKIKVGKGELEDGIKKVRERFQNEDEFQSELRKEGLTAAQFDQRIQDQLAVMKLIDQEIKSKVPTPTEADAKALFAKLQPLLNAKSLSPPPDPTQASKTEEDSLRVLAHRIRQEFGERVRARHILLRLDPKASLVDRTAVKRRIEDLKKRLDRGEDFAELAQRYSEDPGSRERGGDLGSFGRGDMVPPFEAIAFKLAVGQVSQPVETEFGYHIIKIEEKKAARKTAFTDLQDPLREYLFQEHARDRFETWMASLRKSATLKINDVE
ncbi:MAG: peptidylprolyl isomerase [Elusimicrobia bacterium]|nr:peptidylprolyl isomerase [Elusimicrobiota bacterium]